MKRGLIIIGSIVILLAIGVAWFLSSLDTQIKKAIETYGPDILQADVGVRAVRVSILSGEGELRGLVIGNPAGFETESAFRLENIHIALDTDSLTTDVIIIKDITILQPEITYELGSQGSNIDALRKNVDAYVAGKRSETSAADYDDDDGGTKLIIRDFSITGGTIRIRASMLSDQDLTAPLPDLHLTNIGEQSGGATGEEVTRQVLRALAPSITKAVASSGLDSMMGRSKGSLKRATGKLKKLFRRR